MLRREDCGSRYEVVMESQFKKCLKSVQKPRTDVQRFFFEPPKKCFEFTSFFFKFYSIRCLITEVEEVEIIVMETTLRFVVEAGGVVEAASLEVAVLVIIFDQFIGTLQSFLCLKRIFISNILLLLQDQIRFLTNGENQTKLTLLEKEFRRSNH
jgi:hypothetical protein